MSNTYFQKLEKDCDHPLSKRELAGGDAIICNLCGKLMMTAIDSSQPGFADRLMAQLKANDQKRAA